MPCPAPPAGRARIDIHVANDTLTYNLTAPASEPTLGKHRVPKNTQVEWCCDAGPIVIHFYSGKTAKLFVSHNTIIQSAVAGTPTPVETTQNNATKKQYKYSVSVATAGGLIFDDPDFETGGGGGGGGPKKKSARYSGTSAKTTKKR